MADPVTALAAVGATLPPAVPLHPAAAEATLAAPLQALHDAAGAQDFGALMQGPPAAWRPAAPGAAQSLRQSLEGALGDNARELFQSFAGPSAPGALDAMTPAQAAEHFEQVSQTAMRVSTLATGAQIQITVATGLAAAVNNTLHSLLKSNE